MEPNLKAEIMTDEIFGPILPVFPFKDINEAIDFVNDRDEALSVYYFGDAFGENAAKVGMWTSSGSVVTNDCITQLFSHY
jgi:acyl-CoA reductase-like NAD-dependent aldehyde dehydrogenase